MFTQVSKIAALAPVLLAASAWVSPAAGQESITPRTDSDTAPSEPTDAAWLHGTASGLWYDAGSGAGMLVGHIHGDRSFERQALYADITIDTVSDTGAPLGGSLHGEVISDVDVAFPARVQRLLTGSWISLDGGMGQFDAMVYQITASTDVPIIAVGSLHGVFGLPFSLASASEEQALNPDADIAPNEPRTPLPISDVVLTRPPKTDMAPLASALAQLEQAQQPDADVVPGPYAPRVPLQRVPRTDMQPFASALLDLEQALAPNADVVLGPYAPRVPLHRVPDSDTSPFGSALNDLEQAQQPDADVVPGPYAPRVPLHRVVSDIPPFASALQDTESAALRADAGVSSFLARWVLYL